MSNSTYIEPDEFNLQEIEEYNERLKRMKEESLKRSYLKQFLNKACEWIYQQQLVVSDIDKFIADFKKAMEK